MSADGDTDITWTALRLHALDNVATALRDLDVGQRPKMAEGTAPILTTSIPRGHKFALIALSAGEYVVKYGQPIGLVLVDIAPGDHVHLHNLEGLAGRSERRREMA